MRSRRFRGRRPAAMLVIVLGLAGCGQWQRVGSDTDPDPSLVVPRLFDPTGLYAGMGFFAKGQPVPFVATLRYLAGATSDSSLIVFGLSLANSALSFRRSGDAFEAKYRVEVVFRREERVVRRLASDETVRVASFQETLRGDESVIFQQFLALRPGAYDVVVSVRDEYGGSFARDERAVVVPSFRTRRLSSLVAIYEGRGRQNPSELPALLVNPRATAPYGLDTLRFYVEAYRLSGPAELRVQGISPDGDTIWTERATLGGAQLGTAIVEVAPDRLPVGELQVVARLDATNDTAEARALVSFSDQWAITNFVDVLSLLRYFGHDRAIDSMRIADPADRPGLWQAFWRETDPNPVTPGNEALESYFQRLQVANTRFQEAGDQGWLTDRGEVYITLGEPDEIFDQSSNLQGQRRIIRWNYIGERLVLDFVDDTGFGRFRLTPISRSEYQRVLNRIERQGR